MHLVVPGFLLLFFGTLTQLAFAEEGLPKPPNFAMADKGFIECDDPDFSEKTCDSTGAYTSNGDGTYAEVDVLHWRDWPHVDIELRGTTWSKGEMACAIDNEERHRNMSIILAGKRLEGSDLELMRREYAKEYTSIDDREFCQVFLQDKFDPKFFHQLDYVDGKLQPLGLHRTGVIFVRPEDGYRVR